MFSLRFLCCFVFCLGLAWGEAARAQEAAPAEAAPAEATPAIDWRKDYNAARKEAQAKGLPLLIDFMTQSCFWCTELDKRTFKNAEVASAISAKFIPLKIDAGRDQTLASTLGINSFPTVVMASPDGKLLNMVVGFKDVAQFSDSMRQALSQVTPPDWMRQDLAHARKWIDAEDYPRAINSLKLILEDGKARPLQAEAQTLMAILEKKAEARLLRARALQDKGESAKAVEIITDTMRAFPGSRAARDATELLTRMATASDFRKKERSARAQELLQQARDFYKNKEYIPCLDRCEVLLAGFGDLPEGQDGALLANEIKANPEWLQHAADTMSERLGGVYLALADTLLKRGQPDRATFYLNRVITAFPGSRLAESAQIRLEQLQGTSGIRPTGITVTRP